MGNFIRSITSAFVAVFLSFFLIQCGGNIPWVKQANSTTPPANLLKEKEVLASIDQNQLWIAEDGRVLTENDFLDQELTTQSPKPEIEIDVQTLQQAPNVKSYMQEGMITQGNVIPYKQTMSPTKIKVAILLPLSGQHKNVGQAILNASQMALFDVAGQYFELMPRDTKGTIEGAKQAAYDVVENGANLVLGPLFAENARAVKSITQSADINMITFSTDWTIAGSGAYVMGFTPFDQVRRVMLYAASQGHSKQAILAPYSPYGNTVTETFKQVSRHYPSIEPSMIERYRLGDENFNDLIRKFTSYDSRVDTLEEMIADLEMIPENMRTEHDINELARLKIQNTEGDLPFDAIMLPIGGTEIKEISSILKYYDVDLQKARFLGTGLWDTESVYNEVSMQGSWFAAPAPENRLSFEQQYKRTYGNKPPRIASLGYDATALASVLARQSFTKGKDFIFNTESITNPNGFAGIDGIFRFGRNGLIERGLAVLEITGNKPRVVSPAPTTFQYDIH